jgi:hypothetical protein
MRKTSLRFILSRASVALAAMMLSAPLFADKLRLNVGYWPGELEPELEDRFFLDDLVPLPGQLNLGWTGKQTNTIWPLGVQYLKPMGSGILTLGLNYTRYMPEYKYNSLFIGGGLGSAVRIVSLDNYYSTDWDGELGYQFEIGKSGLFLTPKLGFRWHWTGFENNAITLGSIVGVSVGNNQFDANARGGYIGLGLQFYLQKNISLIGEFATTSIFPNFGGSMSYQTTELFLGAGNLISITDQTASYEVQINRWMLGFQYDHTADLHFQVGLREEQQIHSYPGFFGKNFLIVGGAGSIDIDATEIITDKIFWESEKTQKKGLFFFAVSYDINI